MQVNWGQFENRHGEYVRTGKEITKAVGKPALRQRWRLPGLLARGAGPVGGLHSSRLNKKKKKHREKTM